MNLVLVKTLFSITIIITLNKLAPPIPPLSSHYHQQLHYHHHNCYCYRSPSLLLLLSLSTSIPLSPSSLLLSPLLLIITTTTIIIDTTTITTIIYTCITIAMLLSLSSPNKSIFKLILKIWLILVFSPIFSF